MHKYLLSGIILIAMVSSASATTVIVTPPAENIWVGDTFNVTIQCVPSQPIKAWELSFNFNKNVIQANSVHEGNIFSAFDTFFNDGSINNGNGNITDVYDLIIGGGEANMTQNPGILMNITMHAINAGVSTLKIYDAGVTNATHYIPFTISNSSITILSIYDVNADGSINLLDIVSVSDHYGESGTPGWIPQDVNKDGHIKILDLVLIASQW